MATYSFLVSRGVFTNTGKGAQFAKGRGEVTPDPPPSWPPPPFYRSETVLVKSSLIPPSFSAAFYSNAFYVLAGGRSNYKGVAKSGRSGTTLMPTTRK